MRDVAGRSVIYRVCEASRILLLQTTSAGHSLSCPDRSPQHVSDSLDHSRPVDASVGMPRCAYRGGPKLLVCKAAMRHQAQLQ